MSATPDDMQGGPHASATSSEVTSARAVVAAPSAISRARQFLENALIAGLVSAVISGLVLVWGTARIETSKEHIANIARQQNALDSAQNAIFAQLGLYTGKAFETGEVANKDQLQTAIITAQLQVNRLMGELPSSDRDLLLDYSEQLAALSKGVREVKAKSDLGPVYDSAQKLLGLHDRVAEVVRSQMEVTAFWPKH